MCTLSVCLIARDEAAVIGRCLDCVKGFADEIVVVDTGSSDDTKAIAAKYTGNVFDFAWTSDFAAARNFSFEKATMGYVMWLDCDDIIDEANQDAITKLKPTLSGFGCESFMARYRVSPTMTTLVTRIVKNGSCRWAGFVHEYLSGASNRECLDFVVVHSKPLSSIGRDAGRNLKIFESKLEEHIEFSTRDILYFAKELYWNGRYSDAMPWFERFFSRPDGWVEDCVEASLAVADIMNHDGRTEEAAMGLVQSIVKYGMYDRLLYECALTLYRGEKYREAALCFLAIVDGLAIHSKYFVDSTDFWFNSLVWLSCCYWYSGDIGKGKKYHEIAKEVHPDSEVVRKNDEFFL